MDAISLSLSNMHALQCPSILWSQHEKERLLPAADTPDRRPPNVELKSIKMNAQLGRFLIFAMYAENRVKT